MPAPHSCCSDAWVLRAKSGGRTREHIRLKGQTLRSSQQASRFPLPSLTPQPPELFADSGFSEPGASPRVALCRCHCIPDEDTGILTTHTQSCLPFFRSSQAPVPLTPGGAWRWLPRFSSACARLGSCFHGLGAPSPSHEQGLPLTPPPPLRYFGPLASPCQPLLPSSLPLEPSQLFSIALPQSIFPSVFSSCLPALALQSLAPFLSSLSSHLLWCFSSSLSFKSFPQISPSSPFYFSLFPSSVSPIFSSLFSPSLSATSCPLALALPLPCSLHSCPGLTPPAARVEGRGLRPQGSSPAPSPCSGENGLAGKGEGGEGEMGTHGLWAHSKDHSWAEERQRQRDRDAETRREHP